MEDKLKDIFSNTNDWLKFAETKTATLLAANGVIIFGLFRIFKDTETIHNIFLSSVIILLSLSIFVNLLSLIPSLKIPFILYTKKKSENDNLLYFGDIVKYSKTEYLTKIKNGTNEFTEFEQYYASQIIVNSVIALKKYRLFLISIYLTSSAILTLLILLINYL